MYIYIYILAKYHVVFVVCLVSMKYKSLEVRANVRDPKMTEQYYAECFYYIHTYSMYYIYRVVTLNMREIDNAICTEY